MAKEQMTYPERTKVLNQIEKVEYNIAKKEHDIHRMEGVSEMGRVNGYTGISIEILTEENPEERASGKLIKFNFMQFPANEIDDSEMSISTEEIDLIIAKAKRREMKSLQAMKAKANRLYAKLKY